MNIAIIGYGRMGHAVEAEALARGHRVVCHIDKDNQSDFDTEAFRSADVAIEFSVPTTAPANIEAALRRGVAVVSGTTAWTDHMPQIDRVLTNTGGTLMWSSNFSIGVNLFRRISDYAARLLSATGLYSAAIKEIHHIHKLDHPSGTAITLAEGIINADPRLNGWGEPADDGGEPLPPGTLPISHERQGEVPGTHIVKWTSAVDAVTLSHEAFSRRGFALGAVVAAEWLVAHPERTGRLPIDVIFD